MKTLVAGGFLLIAALLAYQTYQNERATWSPLDKKCRGIFTSTDEEKLCKLTTQIEDLGRQQVAQGL